MVQLLKGLPANQLEIIIILTAISIVAAIVTNFSPDYTPWYSRLFWLIRLWDRHTNRLEMLLTPLEAVSDKKTQTDSGPGFISFSEFII